MSSKKVNFFHQNFNAIQGIFILTIGSDIPLIYDAIEYISAMKYRLVRLGHN